MTSATRRKHEDRKFSVRRCFDHFPQIELDHPNLVIGLAGLTVALLTEDHFVQKGEHPENPWAVILLSILHVFVAITACVLFLYYIIGSLKWIANLGTEQEKAPPAAQGQAAGLETRPKPDLELSKPLYGWLQDAYAIKVKFGLSNYPGGMAHAEQAPLARQNNRLSGPVSDVTAPEHGPTFGASDLALRTEQAPLSHEEFSAELRKIFSGESRVPKASQCSANVVPFPSQTKVVQTSPASSGATEMNLNGMHISVSEGAVCEVRVDRSGVVSVCVTGNARTERSA